MDVTIVVATFGDEEWCDLAAERAVPSAEAQGVPVLHRHIADGGIAEARNACLDMVDTEWVIHLDADDELEPGYVGAMEKGTADVRGPLVRYMQNGAERNLWQPRVWNHRHDCEADCLKEGNWLVVGSAVRTNMLRDVGAWVDYPWSEDWATWIRCWQAGASFELIRDAVYRAHVRPDSRNRGATREEKLAAHQMIYDAHFG